MIQKSIRAYVKLIFILGLLLTFVGEMIYPTTALAEDSSKTEVIIRKYAEEDYSKLLEGAKLSVTSTDGSFKEDFDSDATGKKLELLDGTYTLTELTPPPGYKVADPIRFQVENKQVFILGEGGSKIKNPNKEEKSPYSVEAYADGMEDDQLVVGTPYGKFYYAKNKDQTIQVVYCFNADLSAPPDSWDNGATIDPSISELGKDIRYTHVSGRDIYRYAKNPRVKNPTVFLKRILKVMDKGYKAKGQKHKKLDTEVKYRAATQLALYYYTDSADVDRIRKHEIEYHGLEKIDSQTMEVVDEMIQYAEDDSEPQTKEIDFFVPNSSRYQSLIGTSYHPNDLVDIIRMEDSLASVVPVTHSLTISKQVVGTIADKQKEFQFELQLKASDGNLIDQTFQTNSGELKVTNGKATFTLKDGQSLMISGLPTGYTCEIKETDASDYIISVDGQVSPDATARKTSVSKDETVTFENRKDLVPPTGLTTDISTYLVLLLVPFGLLFWLYSRKRSTND